MAHTVQSISNLLNSQNLKNILIPTPRTEIEKSIAGKPLKENTLYTLFKEFYREDTIDYKIEIKVSYSSFLDKNNYSLISKAIDILEKNKIEYLKVHSILSESILIK